MANEFKIKNGFFSEGSSNVTGSLTVSAGITGSLLGTASFATTTLLENNTDRAAKSTFSIKVNGYILPNSVNKSLAIAGSKFYTKSQIVFDIETTGSL